MNPKTYVSLLLGLMLHLAAHAQATEPELRGDRHFTDGFIATGSGYHGPTGRIARTVVDLTVPGSVGMYPLKLQRTMRNWVTNNHSNPNLPTWNEEAGCSAYWVFNTIGYGVRIQDYGYAAEQGVYLRYPDGTEDHMGSSAQPGVYTFGNGDRVYVDGSLNVTALKLSDGGTVNLAKYPNVKSWYTTSVVDPYGLSTVYSFVGNAARITDASGRWVQLVYGTAGPIRGESSAGDYVDYTFDYSVPAGLRVQAVNSAKLMQASYADGTVATYEYTSNVHGVFPYRCFDVRAQSGMQSVEYQFNHNRVYWNDVHQRQYLALYPLLNERLPYSGTAISSRTETITGDALSVIKVIETRGDGATRSMLPRTAINPWSFGGRLRSEKDFSGNEWAYAYGSTETTTDPLGRVTSTEFWYLGPNASDIIKNPKKITHADGTFAQLLYTDGQNPYYVSQSINERGFITSYDRLPNKLISQINYPDNSNEAWTYNNLNQPLTHRLKNGNTESFQYDGTGLLTKHLLPTSPDAIDYTYYPAGHVWKDRIKTKSDGRGNLTTFEYDLAFVNGAQGTSPCPGRGLITKIINPDGTYKSFGFDIYGNKVWEENELRQRTNYAYDAFRRLTSSMDPLGRITQYQYQHSGFSENALAHAENKPRVVISPSGRRIGRWYDADFRLITETMGESSGDASTTSFEYDAVGNLKKVTDPASRVTTYAYDNRNRRITEAAPLGRTTDINYDAVGNVIWTHYPDGSVISKEYDSMDRLTRSFDELSRQTNYSYHPSGKVQWIIDPKNNAYGYWYDAADRPTVFWLTNPGQTGFDFEQTGYDAAGNVTSFRNRSGAWKTLAYDSRNRETSTSWNDGITPATGTGYDAASRVTQKTNAHSTLTYGYDVAGQLSHEQQAVAGATTRTVQYSYDGDGNRSVVKVQ